MKDLYYNIEDGEFIDQSGEKLSRFVPELFYQETAVWRIFLRDRENRPCDISGIIAWSAAVDRDYDSATTPMCRVLPESISAAPTTGCVTVTLDAATAEFLAAVNGFARRKAFFEMHGVNAAGDQKLYFGFEISARMILDPAPGVPQQVPEIFATRIYADLTAANAVSGAIFSGAEIETRVGDYLLTYTSCGGLSVSGAGASVVLSGGEIAAAVSDGVSMTINSRGFFLTDNEFGGSASLTAGTFSANGGAVLTQADTSDFATPEWIGSQNFARQLVTSTDELHDSAHFEVLSGGESYDFTWPLESLIVDSVVKTTEASYLHFALDSVTAPTPVVISGVSYLNNATFESGKEYLLRFFDGMMETREVLPPAEYPIYGSRGVFLEKNGAFTSSAMDMSDTVIVSGCTMHIFSQGIVSNCITLSGGAMSLYGLGASVTDVTVSSGGKFNITLDTDYDPADFSVIAGSQTDLASGTLHYQNNAFAGECAGGEFIGLSGTYRIGIGDGIAALTPVIGNSDTETTRIYVFSGGAVSGGSVGISGAIVVYGGTIDGVHIAGYSGEKVDGTVVVRGGTATNVAVSANGSLRVLDSGIANSAVVESDGYLTISSGGAVNYTTLNDQGRLAISSGGSAYETIVNSDGKMYVSADASVSSTHIYSGGIMYVSSGATVSKTFVKSGGRAYFYNGAVGPGVSALGGTVYISYGGMVSSSVLQGSGRLFVSSGGVASRVIIGSTGSTYLFPGGTANDISVRSDAKLFVSSGGVASDVDVFSGGSMRIHSGGTALAVNSRAGALITVSSGGYIEYVTP